jgi:epoxyqueuosine reductase
MAASADISVSKLIKEKALALGFDLCGISKARPLKERESILKNWCAAGMNGEMNYLARNIEKRIDPRSLVPEAKSLVVTGLGYYTDEIQSEPGVPVISRYAFGTDYHLVIEKKLEKLLAFIRTIRPEALGRSFVDSAPLMEKAWACEAGLGWQGRHSIVINKKIGSFFFIGILILNIELEYDKKPEEDHCGTCTLCIDLCPTGAINLNRTIDARKCIANLTIENRGPVPEDIIPKLGRRVYGCDLCQEVCPWNKKVKQKGVKEFELPEKIRNMSPEEWINLSEDQFNKFFGNSAIARRKYKPFMRNVTIVAKSDT